MWCMYQPAWEHLPEMRSWLSQSPNDRSKAFCKICKIDITAIISSLREHAKKHQHDEMRSEHSDEEFWEGDEEELEEGFGDEDDEIFIEEEELEEDDVEVGAESVKQEAVHQEISEQESAPVEPPVFDSKSNEEGTDRNLRKRKQPVFKSEWKNIPELSPWLTRSVGHRSSAFCKVCNKEMNPVLSQLLFHAGTSPHKRRIESSANSVNKTMADENESEEASPIRRSRRLRTRKQKSWSYLKKKRRIKLESVEAGIVLRPAEGDAEKDSLERGDGDENIISKSNEAQGDSSDSELNFILKTEEDSAGEGHVFGPVDDLDDDHDNEWSERGPRPPGGGFKESWKRNPRFSRWLRRSATNSRRGFCLFCYRELAGTLAHIERHAETPIHRRKEASWKEADKSAKTKEIEPGDEGRDDEIERETKRYETSSEGPSRILEYNPSWESDPDLTDWLCRSEEYPQLAFCIVCQKNLTPKFMHLRRHAATKRHGKLASGEPEAVVKKKRVYFNQRRLGLVPKRARRRSIGHRNIEKVNTDYGEIHIEYGAMGDPGTNVATEVDSPVQADTEGTASENAESDARHQQIWAALEAMEEMKEYDEKIIHLNITQKPAPPAGDIVQQSLEKAEAHLTDLEPERTSAIDIITEPAERANPEQQPRRRGRQPKIVPRLWVTSTGKICKDYTSYNPRWEQLPGLSWVRPMPGNPRQAFCGVCRRPIVAKLALLNRHRFSERHLKRTLAAHVDGQTDADLDVLLRKRKLRMKQKIKKRKQPSMKKAGRLYLPPDRPVEQPTDPLIPCSQDDIDVSNLNFEQIETSEQPFDSGTRNDAGIYTESIAEEIESNAETGQNSNENSKLNEGHVKNEDDYQQLAVEGPDDLWTSITDEPVRGLVAKVLPKFAEASSSTSSGATGVKSAATPVRQSARKRRPVQPLCVLEDEYLSTMRSMYQPKASVFHRVWKKHPDIGPWLQQSPWVADRTKNQPFCAVCRHELTPKTAHLIRHGRTGLHMRRMQERGFMLAQQRDVHHGEQQEDPLVDEAAPLLQPAGGEVSEESKLQVEVHHRSAEPVMLLQTESASDCETPEATDMADTEDQPEEETSRPLSDICRVCKHPLLHGVNIFHTRTAFSRTLVVSKLCRLLQVPDVTGLTDAEVCTSCVKLLNELDESEMRVTALENEVKLKFKMPCPLAVQGHIPPINSQTGPESQEGGSAQVQHQEDDAQQASPTADEVDSVEAGTASAISQPEQHKERADAAGAAAAEEGLDQTTIIVQDPPVATDQQQLPVQKEEDGMPTIDGPVQHVVGEDAHGVEVQAIEVAADPDEVQTQIVAPSDTYFTVDENGQLKPITALYDAEGNMLNIMYQMPEEEAQAVGHVVDMDNTAIYWEPQELQVEPGPHQVVPAVSGSTHQLRTADGQEVQIQHLEDEDGKGYTLQINPRPQGVPPEAVRYVGTKRTRKKSLQNSGKRPRKTLRDITPDDEPWKPSAWDAQEFDEPPPTPALPAPPNWQPPEVRPRGRPRRDAPPPGPIDLVFGQCSACGQIFQDNEVLKKHMLRVHSDLMYRCGICQRPFLHKSSLKEHELRHKGVNSACDLCGKLFSAPSDVVKHKKFVHTVERAFPCPHCSYAGKFRWMLERHKRAVHGPVV